MAQQAYIKAEAKKLAISGINVILYSRSFYVRSCIKPIQSFKACMHVIRYDACMSGYIYIHTVIISIYIYISDLVSL